MKNSEREQQIKDLYEETFGWGTFSNLAQSTNTKQRSEQFRRGFLAALSFKLAHRRLTPEYDRNYAWADAFEYGYNEGLKRIEKYIDDKKITKAPFPTNLFDGDS